MLWKTEILRYQNIHGLNVTRQAMDCAHRKTPIGRDRPGMRPVDKKKQGTKLCVLSNEDGVIIGISVGSARDHDIQLCHKTPQ